MKFTKDIFQKFNRKKQGKKLIELIAKIDVEWQNEPLREDLLKEFQTYLKYMNYETGSDITSSSKREFLALAVPIEQEFGKTPKDDEFIILKDDKHSKKNIKNPLYLILDDLRSAFNVGSIFRTAECFGISHIYLCGYTPTPENKKVQKTAMGTDEYVNWSTHASVENVIKELREDGFTIYALETTTHSIDISKTKFKKPCALILGNEALGISEETLKIADEII
ncbi:MAG: RNA methyltransferase, partial [Candidatus Cloacimonadota bacterium]|nr:RNA methyltransferase [Candidatus Cloacimonadota bacterium]